MLKAKRSFDCRRAILMIYFSHTRFFLQYLSNSFIRISPLLVTYAKFVQLTSPILFN